MSPNEHLFTMPGSKRRAPRHRSAANSRVVLFLAGIWLLGLLALAAVIQFERQVDGARKAQVVIAQMRVQQGALLTITFAPLTSDKAHVPTTAVTAHRLAAAKASMSDSVATLDSIGHSEEPSRLETLDQRYFRFVDHLSTVIAAGSSLLAAQELGGSARPGGSQAVLTAELDHADASYGAYATRSKEVAVLGTIVAILSLLLAFSIAFFRLVRGRRRTHLDANTDSLTGLGNRRKLFADAEHRLGSLRGGDVVGLGIFDLDGFKGYNDTFGHPAGDALLERLGRRLEVVVGERGSAYRIGGDEFVVLTTELDGERVLAAAQIALSERGKGFEVGCSLGSTTIVADVSLEQALHVADQRLYRNKRSSRRVEDGQAHDVLLRVLSEGSETLATHVSNVGRLAGAVAARLGLSEEEVTLARLTGDLHDIGKTAIPDVILDKRGPLDESEWLFMRRHTLIGERILSAAPALARVAPAVRSTHERFDGAGYPDGISGEEIPISARIVAVVDAYDAMTSDRPYRSVFGQTQALREILRCAGTQFDPRVAEAFVEVCRETAGDEGAIEFIGGLAPVAA